MQETTGLAVIGGSGSATPAGFSGEEERRCNTPFGEPSATVLLGRLNGLRALYLPRHGDPHALAPHLVNYRANIWALRELGAARIVALNTVGGISTPVPPGSLVLPDQIIDYSWGRPASFYDGGIFELRHQEFAHPYDAQLRAMLRDAAAAAGIALVDGAVYGCTQGPRLETAAEIRRLERDGCDLVGMTAMPEAALAAELGIPYASIAMVVNWAAGKGSEAISMEEIRREAAACMFRVHRLLEELAARLARAG